MFLVLIVTLNECKKLGLIALFLSNILKWKYYTAILMVVFNSVNKFCCFFTFKVSSTCCYSFSEWVLFTAFSIFRIYTNDGGGGDNVIWCDVICVSRGKTNGRPIFLSTFCKQVKKYCLVLAVPFEKLFIILTLIWFLSLLLRKISIPYNLIQGWQTCPCQLGSSQWESFQGVVFYFSFGFGVSFYFLCTILQNP